MPRTRSTLLPTLTVLGAALLGLLAPGTGQAAAGSAPARGCKASGLRPTTSSRSQARARRAVLCLLNVERRSHGLRPLRAEVRLRRAASRHSINMVASRFFDHTSPGGSTMASRIASSGYRRSRVVGENLAWGDGALATPRAVVNAWMHSPGHRANILDGRFREIGIGIAVGTPRGFGTGRATYTTDFGRRA